MDTPFRNVLLEISKLNLGGQLHEGKEIKQNPDVVSEFHLDQYS